MYLILNILGYHFQCKYGNNHVIRALSLLIIMYVLCQKKKKKKKKKKKCFMKTSNPKLVEKRKVSDFKLDRYA